jgi:hypothetical protein
LEDGTPCTEVQEGPMPEGGGGAYPTPVGWSHLSVHAVVGGGAAGDHASDLDLFFHSRGCEGRWHDGQFAQWLLQSDAAE